MIAFLGLGLLGSNFVRALVQRGKTVHVWNRTAEKARVLEAEGAVAFDDPAAAVRSAARVHLCLSDDAAVDDVLARAAEGFAEGAVLVDHTTTSAAGAAERAARWAERGHPYLHAPVFMGPQNALEGSGIMLASGDAALFEALRPDLEPMTGRLVYLGAAPDRAAGLKLVGNLFLATITAGLGDAFALARAVGVPESDVTGLFDVFNPGAMIPARAQRLIARDYDHPSWNLAMARKDTRLMLEGAEGAGVPLTVVPAIAREMDRYLAEGHADADWSIMTRDALG